MYGDEHIAQLYERIEKARRGTIHTCLVLVQTDMMSIKEAEETIMSLFEIS